MEGVHDNASAFMHLNIKSKKYWVKLTFQTKLSHLCQKATFLNFMVMQIRKPENEGNQGVMERKIQEKNCCIISVNLFCIIIWSTFVQRKQIFDTFMIILSDKTEKSL